VKRFLASALCLETEEEANDAASTDSLLQSMEMCSARNLLKVLIDDTNACGDGTATRRRSDGFFMVTRSCTSMAARKDTMKDTPFSLCTICSMIALSIQ
jgi:hypothetical protein